MALFRSYSTSSYSAQCEACDTEIGPLSNNIQIAAYRLLDHGWIVLEDYETTFCSESCLDEHEISHIEEVLDGG